MAVSKRTRFEVLRRDEHTCRYCGQSAPDVKLTIDHVLPVALGGTDDPGNLVAACRDCNAGKASTSPDEHRVAQVADDALRWAAAMKRASELAHMDRAQEQAMLTHFRDHVWRAWRFGPKDKPNYFDLPIDWESAIRRQIEQGLTMGDLEHAVNVALTNKYVNFGDEFRYFMGVCRGMLSDRMDRARTLIDGGDI